MKYKILLKFLTLFLFFCLGGCSYVKPYHAPVQQGNVLDNKSVQQLQLGMSKEETEEVLGTPVLRNAFADNYLTYIYTNQINGGKIEKKQLTLYFAENKLAKIEKHNV